LNEKVTTFLTKDAGSTMYPKLMRQIKFKAAKLGIKVPDRLEPLYPNPASCVSLLKTSRAHILFCRSRYAFPWAVFHLFFRISITNLSAFQSAATVTAHFIRRRRQVRLRGQGQRQGSCRARRQEGRRRRRRRAGR
jgi:hypothetical protein